MAEINIGGQIRLRTNTTNIDAKYGPYPSLEDAWDTLSAIGDQCIGLTIGIQENRNEPITEYWFRDAASSIDDLIVKAQAPTIIDGGNAPSASSNYNGKGVEG